MSCQMALHLLKVGACRHCERVAIRGGRWAAIEFPALAGLIVHPEYGPILFDTGYATHFMRATTPFPERLYRWATPITLPAQQTLCAQLWRFGFTLSDIGLCVISHFHADHIAGLRDLPNARFICTASGYTKMTTTKRIPGLMRGLLPVLLPVDFQRRVEFAENMAKIVLPAPWQIFGEGVDLLGDGSIIGISLPGHAAGQMGLLLQDQSGRDVFLCADACWSRAAFGELRMPSILARPLMDDWCAYRQTMIHLHTLAERHAELIILPSHCEQSLAAYQPGWSNS